MMDTSLKLRELEKQVFPFAIMNNVLMRYILLKPLFACDKGILTSGDSVLLDKIYKN